MPLNIIGKHVLAGAGNAFVGLRKAELREIFAALGISSVAGRRALDRVSLVQLASECSPQNRFVAEEKVKESNHSIVRSSLLFR